MNLGVAVVMLMDWIIRKAIKSISKAEVLWIKHNCNITESQAHMCKLREWWSLDNHLDAMGNFSTSVIEVAIAG